MQRAVWAAVFVAATVGCGSSRPPAKEPAAAACSPTNPVLSIVASERANSSAAGQGRPVQVRVYQLKSDARLVTAKFEDIWQSDKTALEADLVKVEEIHRFSRRDETREGGPSPDAHTLAAVALFREPQGKNWFFTYELASPRKESPCPPSEPQHLGVARPDANRGRTGPRDDSRHRIRERGRRATEMARTSPSGRKGSSSASTIFSSKTATTRRLLRDRISCGLSLRLGCHRARDRRASARAPGSFKLKRFAAIWPDGESIRCGEGTDEAPPRPALFRSGLSRPTRQARDLRRARPRSRRRGEPGDLATTARSAAATTRVERTGHDRQHRHVGARVDAARPNLRIFFGNERHDGFSTIRVAELVRRANGQPMVRDNYVPPVLHVSAGALSPQRAASRARCDHRPATAARGENANSGRRAASIFTRPTRASSGSCTR